MKYIKNQFQQLLPSNVYAFLNSWYIPIILAFLSTVIIVNKINHYKKSLSSSMQTGDVLIVNKSLFKGDTIKKDDIDIASLSLKHLPAGTLHPSDINQIIGTALNRSLAKNELLLWSFLDIDSFNKLPSDQIEPGHRLIALPINSTDSMGFRIQKGDHIDLIHTTVLNGDQTASTYTLLQNIIVLGVGENNDKNTDLSYNTVNLMVLPKEALMIKNAQENGQLSFLLRNSIDQKTTTNLSIVTSKDIAEQVFRNTLQYERNKVIELIKGNKKLTQNNKLLESTFSKVE